MVVGQWPVRRWEKVDWVVTFDRDIAEVPVNTCFENIALIDEGARLATITATSELSCYGVTFWDFRPLVEANGVIGWKLLQSLARMYREARAG